MMAKNLLRAASSLQHKILILSTGVVAGGAFDVTTKHLRLSGSQLHLGAIASGIAVKTLDRELNLFLRENRCATITCCLALSIIPILVTELDGPATLLWASTEGLGTATKHLHKQWPKVALAAYSILIPTTALYDISHSSFSATVPVITLLFKEGIRKMERWQTGKGDSDEEENENSTHEIAPINHQIALACLLGCASYGIIAINQTYTFIALAILGAITDKAFTRASRNIVHIQYTPSQAILMSLFTSGIAAYLITLNDSSITHRSGIFLSAFASVVFQQSIKKWQLGKI